MKNVSLNSVKKNQAEMEAEGYTFVREGNTTGLSDGTVVLCETTGNPWDCIREIWRAWATTFGHIHNVRPVAPERVAI
jgi:hypothetical protein